MNRRELIVGAAATVALAPLGIAAANEMVTVEAPLSPVIPNILTAPGAGLVEGSLVSLLGETFRVASVHAPGVFELVWVDA